jgi:glutamate N-acetyltransferase/amino-acid N-acetyltransferase
MSAILASGDAQNPIIDSKNADYQAFAAALTQVNLTLAKLIAKDGEGATKLLECSVSGAADDGTARRLAKSVVGSSLFKAAMFGADANWGRILCALGYSGAEFDATEVGVSFSSKAGEVEVCRGGAAVSFSEVRAKEILSEAEIEIRILVGTGDGAAVAWGCDLTYDYVKINGDYRS